MFPEKKSRKHMEWRENKTNCFPEGPYIKCFVIFQDFHFNSNKRITGANQNSRLGTYNNTNLILKTTEWMIYKVLSLYHLHLFPPLAAVSLQGWLKNSLPFSLKLRVCVQVVVFIHKKEIVSVFPAFCHTIFHHALITCCNPERGTLPNVSRSGYIWF